MRALEYSVGLARFADRVLQVKLYGKPIEEVRPLLKEVKDLKVLIEAATAQVPGDPHWHSAHLRDGPLWLNPPTDRGLPMDLPIRPALPARFALLLAGHCGMAILLRALCDANAACTRSAAALTSVDGGWNAAGL